VFIDLKYLENSDIYWEIIDDGLLKAVQSVWIASANVKNLRIKSNKRYGSIVAVFEKLVKQGVSIRLLHSGQPSVSFQERFEKSRLPFLSGFQIIRCPRVHFKAIIIDHKKIYIGSANLTGSGIGIKDEKNRNFEIGVVSEDPLAVQKVEIFFDFIWRGEMCPDCGRRDICEKPIQ